jgi:polysaccharide deacetylase family protein (PEP-CTERM system associated)
VGAVAEKHRRLIRRIAREGHEIGCHSYAHELVSRLTPAQFREDLRRGKGILEQLTGRPVVGYRAPNYSIGPAQQWAYEALADAGFIYDSSSYPIHHDRYGSPGAPRFPYLVWQDGDRRLIEFPIGTARLLGMNMPIGGGGYFRLLPVDFTRRGIRRVNDVENQGVMFYFHPWELDAGQPRTQMPLHHRFRHYVNLERFEEKLTIILETFAFAPAVEVLRGLGSVVAGLAMPRPQPLGTAATIAADASSAVPV